MILMTVQLALIRYLKIMFYSNDVRFDPASIVIWFSMVFCARTLIILRAISK